MRLTSQNMDPERPLSWTYLALREAMCGVSYDTSSFFAASYEKLVTSVRFSKTVAPARGRALYE